MNPEDLVQSLGEKCLTTTLVLCVCAAVGGLCQAVCPEAGERCRAGRVPVPLQPTREPGDLCTQEGQGGPSH